MRSWAMPGMLKNVEKIFGKNVEKMLKNIENIVEKMIMPGHGPKHEYRETSV
jgi:hypothetical protein